MNSVRNETAPRYELGCGAESKEQEDAVIERALGILRKRLTFPKDEVSSAADVQHYLALNLAQKEFEVFGALLLNSRNAVIENYQPFSGTVNECHVYPRVLVKKALEVNAVSVILYHNHPSGNPKPSDEDISLTRKVKQLLEAFDINLFDHVIVGGTSTLSFFERGLL